jgi:hypothetical protein
MSEKKLKILLDKMESLENKINILLELHQKDIPEMKQSCKRMNSHIMGVESVYSYIRKPLFSILSYIPGGEIYENSPLPIMDSSSSKEN